MPKIESDHTKTPQVSQPDWRNPSTPLVGAGVILIAIVLLGTAFVAGVHSRRWSLAGKPSYMMSRNKDRLGMMGARHLGGTFNTSDRAVGVVTQVSGDHVTVASNGATKDVYTNTSTQYQGGDSVKNNDTVIAQGTTTANQFTADRVIINP